MGPISLAGPGQSRLGACGNRCVVRYRMSRQNRECGRTSLSWAVAAAGWIMCGVVSTPCQTTEAAGALRTAKPMVLSNTRFEVRIGESTAIPAPPETLSFLLQAKTRKVAIEGQDASGLVVASNETQDRILLVPT